MECSRKGVSGGAAQLIATQGMDRSGAGTRKALAYALVAVRNIKTEFGALPGFEIQAVEVGHTVSIGGNVEAVFYC